MVYNKIKENRKDKGHSHQLWFQVKQGHFLLAELWTHFSLACVQSPLRSNLEASAAVQILKKLLQHLLYYFLQQQNWTILCEREREK